MIVGTLISGAAALWVRSSYARWSKQQSSSGLTGAEVARMILDRNGLTRVRVEPVPGVLTDHYDPRAKAVRLSEGNFRGSSVAAVSVAAHECGHALQDAGGYVPMKLRAGIFPLVNLGAQLWLPLFLLGVMGFGELFIQLAVIAFSAVLLFHIVTLPVEIDASRRAYRILSRYGVISLKEGRGVRRVLTAAAFTYIAAALTALLTLLYLLFVSRNQ
ncbi:MAG: zinc metallopeptidase [Rubrobacter sp.]|nr:zinc metallopeptidase [Rubrobacter sp.]